LEFRDQPRTARFNFASTRLFVDTPFTARFPLEVFYGVGDIALRTVDPNALQGLIENLTRWSDKWLPGLIFLITGLFADKDDTTPSTFTENRLSGV
jgi:hypothetical protein